MYIGQTQHLKKIIASKGLKVFFLPYLVALSSLMISLVHNTPPQSSEHVSGAERWELPLPAHVGVRSPAPPLKVAADRSAQFRSPLTYNFIPLRWNRSTLAHI